jgi:beta-lactam-binding protein with PASTA domain
VGLDLEDAVDRVACLGLRVMLDPSDASKAGLVIGQTPPAGAEVPVAGTVLLRVHAPG